jgi:hypothetical protein
MATGFNIATIAITAAIAVLNIFYQAAVKAKEA